jgi:hypothetical protein
MVYGLMDGASPSSVPTAMIASVVIGTTATPDLSAYSIREAFLREATT